MTWTVTIAPGTTGDEKAINELLSEAGLTPGAFEDNATSFLVMKSEGRLVGCVALLMTEHYGFVRSLAVCHDFRNRGLAKQMMREVVDRAIRFKLFAIYLLTVESESFFRRIGFRPQDRDKVPEVILGLDQFQDECCRDASLLAFKFPDSSQQA